MALNKDITFWASCDFCVESFDTDALDFTEAVEVMKKKGWKVYRTGSDWNHKCPDCQSFDGKHDFDVIV